MVWMAFAYVRGHDSSALALTDTELPPNDTKEMQYHDPEVEVQPFDSVQVVIYLLVESLHILY